MNGPGYSTPDHISAQKKNQIHKQNNSSVLDTVPHREDTFHHRYWSAAENKEYKYILYQYRN